MKCLTFCSRYLHDVETKFTRQQGTSVVDETGVEHEGLTILHNEGVLLEAATIREITNVEWQQFHLYVLINEKRLENT